jgi:hypothetical protein
MFPTFLLENNDYPLESNSLHGILVAPSGSVVRRGHALIPTHQTNSSACYIELHGYKVANEDEWNWAMVKDSEVPIVIPHEGDCVEII